MDNIFGDYELPKKEAEKKPEDGNNIFGTYEKTERVIQEPKVKKIAPYPEYASLISKEFSKMNLEVSYMRRLMCKTHIVDGHFICKPRNQTNMLGVTWTRPHIYAEITSEPYCAEMPMKQLKDGDKLKYDGFKIEMRNQYYNDSFGSEYFDQEEGITTDSIRDTFIRIAAEIGEPVDITGTL